MLNETFSRRFEELEDKFAQFPRHRNSMGSGHHYSTGDWRGWATSAQSLIRAVYGESSPQYQNFLALYNDCTGGDHQVEGLRGLFLAAKSDFDGGYVFNVDLRVSGEVFGDFVVLAKQALSEGHKDVAAVLACTALEDALKRFAAVNGLSVDGQTMQDVINALKSKGLVAGAQKSLLDAMPKIRNHALHANWDRISETEVSSVIGFVEQFLLSKFSAG